MIHDQGEMIGKLEKNPVFCVQLMCTFSFSNFSFKIADSIEANVENAEVHVDRGAVQLQKAAYYQV